MLLKNHWDLIYKKKSSDQLSWTEDIPQTSLELIDECRLSDKSAIIDVGGGESKLVDFLIHLGYADITVLDISERSMARTKERLEMKSEIVRWIVQDILEFETDRLFDCWHDRAAFHFLTTPEWISKYAALAKRYIKQNGYLIIGTFSKNGPKKCSGLSIKQYNAEEMFQVFSDGFKKVKCITLDHETPFHTKQNFLYCLFQRV